MSLSTKASRRCLQGASCDAPCFLVAPVCAGDVPNNSKVGREGVRLQTDAMHASCQSGGGAALSLRGIRRPSAAQLNEESSSYIVLWMKAATGKKGKA